MKSGNKVLEGEYSVLNWFALKRQALQKVTEATQKPKESFELVKSEAIVRPFKQGRATIPFTFRRPVDVTFTVDAVKAEAVIAGPGKRLQITVTSEVKTKSIIQAAAPSNTAPTSQGGAASRGTPRARQRDRANDNPTSQQRPLATASNNRPASQTPGPRRRQTATQKQL